MIDPSFWTSEARGERNLLSIQAIAITVDSEKQDTSKVTHNMREALI